MQKGENLSKIYPVCRGCRTLEIAKTMCASGFAAFSELDPGYFAKGLYFTHDLDYAMTYAKEEDNHFTLLIAAACSSSIFPVIELPSSTPPNPKTGEIGSLYGQPMIAGFDTHFVSVNKAYQPCIPPKSLQHMMKDTRERKLWSEYVFQETGQIVPRYVVSYKKLPSTSNTNSSSNIDDKSKIMLSDSAAAHAQLMRKVRYSPSSYDDSYICEILENYKQPLILWIDKTFEGANEGLIKLIVSKKQANLLCFTSTVDVLNFFNENKAVFDKQKYDIKIITNRNRNIDSHDAISAAYQTCAVFTAFKYTATVKILIFCGNPKSVEPEIMKRYKNVSIFASPTDLVSFINS